MTLPRTRLLARLFASEPRLVQFCAPGGYGKSSLSRLFARHFDRSAICDCSGVEDAVDLAGRAISALARESQNGGDAISLERLRLHASEADVASWSRTLLEAWKARQGQALFILEHAEAVAKNSGALALLGDMLAARPAGRVVLISSRVALPLRFSQYVAPHQIITLTCNELRLDVHEARSVFEGTDLAVEIAERIILLADGCPVVLLLLALFARYDARIETLIDRLSEVAKEDLHEHLASELLSEFTPDMTSTILAAAAIPNASLEDLSAATGIPHPTPIVDRLLRLPGFVSSETGAYQIHPLLLAQLRARHGQDLPAHLFRAAQYQERAGDFLRAAELYAAYGDHGAAATALDRLPTALFQQPSPRFIDALVKIDVSVLCTFPNLWIATLPYRRQNVPVARLHDEARTLLESVSQAASPSVHRRLCVRLALLAQELECLAEARALVEALEPRGAFDEAPEERRLILMASAMIAAKQGLFTQVDALIDESDFVQGPRNVRFEAERAQIAMDRARFLGDWNEVLKMSEDALYAAQRSGATTRIIDAARAVAASAWYCNDDARVTAATQLLEDCGDEETHAFLACVEAALSRSDVQAPARLHNMARWHAALATTDGELAKELFDQAIDGMDQIENAFLQIVIRVSAALLLQSQRRRLLEARVIAQKVESPPLQASIELLIDSTEPSDFGIFKHVAARAARSPLKARQDVLRVEIVRGLVRRGADSLPVSARGFELLAALALVPPGTSKEELANAIWPGLDAEAALNSLKMCVSRTRAQVGDKDAIQSTKHGYALTERAVVDVRDYQRLLRDVHGASALNDPARRRVEEAVSVLLDRQYAREAGWAWFAPYVALLDDLQRELALVLTNDRSSQDDRFRMASSEHALSS